MDFDFEKLQAEILAHVKKLPYVLSTECEKLTDAIVAIVKANVPKEPAKETEAEEDEQEW